MHRTEEVSSIDLPLLGLLQTETGVGHIRAIVNRNVGILCQTTQQQPATATRRRTYTESTSANRTNDSFGPNSSSPTLAGHNATSAVQRLAQQHGSEAADAWLNHSPGVPDPPCCFVPVAAAGACEPRERRGTAAAVAARRAESWAQGGAGMRVARTNEAARRELIAARNTRERETQGWNCRHREKQPLPTSLSPPTRRLSQGKHTQIAHEGQHAERTHRIHQVRHLLSTGNLLFAKLRLNS